MQSTSRPQLAELVGRFSNNTDWGSLEQNALQTGVIELSAEEFGRRMTAFLRNNCQLIVKGPGVLIIDRTAPFDPVKFIGQGWEIVEEDKKALTLTTVDFASVRFESGLREGEQTIDGEEKLKRLKRLGIRLDAKCGQALYEEEGQVTLRWLYDTFGIAWLELSGTVLRGPGGSRYFLCLYRGGGGSWYWGCHWLGHDRRQGGVSPLLAS